jgi:hypothetical protein
MALLKTDGTAPNKDSTVDGKFKRIVLAEGGYVPANSTDTGGEIGEISVDSAYIYVKIAAGTWRRAAHGSF